MDKNIRLMVVDDQALVRKGIAMCLAAQDHLEVVGEVGDPRELLERAIELQPDVVLMDISMPHMNGLTATNLLHHELPEAKVLILSIHGTPEYVCQAVQAGAQGYLLKSTSVEDLLHAIETVYHGESYFNSNVVHEALSHYIRPDPVGLDSTLTGREREVLVLIAEGKSNKESAAKLGVSVRTVETHREHLMRKLDIHSTAQLVRYALANGYVTDGNQAK